MGLSCGIEHRRESLDVPAAAAVLQIRGPVRQLLPASPLVLVQFIFSPYASIEREMGTLTVADPTLTVTKGRRKKP